MSTSKKQTAANISRLLAGATCTLLNQAASAQDVAQDTNDPKWDVETAVLYYSEKDRVSAIEPVFSATRTFESGNILNIKAVVDVLTGASPNGATPFDGPQTFTRPSGNDSYTIAAGETPLDDTFLDTRVAIGAQYDYSLGRLTHLSSGLNFSNEYDYQSISVNTRVAREFNDKNTSLSAGFAFAADSIEPEGGIPKAFTSMPEVEDDLNRQGSSESKDTLDLLLGVTQVINRKTLMQVNYSFSNSEGYLTDPFKILTLANSSTGAPEDYLYENRPDSRTKHSIYWKTKYHRENGHIIDASYRYLWDDWDITSHTLDFRYRWPLASGHYIEPHVRYYSQEEASFYRHSLTAGEALPEFATADSRLGQFDAMTYGAKYGIPMGENGEFSIRLELYRQNGSTVGTPIGDQVNYDLFPDLEATIVQFGYSFQF